MAGNYRETLAIVRDSMTKPVSPEDNVSPDARLHKVFREIKEVVTGYKKQGHALTEIPSIISYQSLGTQKYYGFREYIDGGDGDRFEAGVWKQSIWAGGRESVLMGFDGHVDGKPVHYQYRIYDGYQYSLFVAGSVEPAKPEWINVEDAYTDSYRSHIALVEQLCHAAFKRIYPGPSTGG